MARLGDYIEQVNVRNRDLKVTKLVGLTIDKKFIPSVANVIGTDLSNYKVIKHEQFACSLMQVSRDGKMPVAMFEGDNAIMSPAYPMFEVKDKSKLLPQYLMMWFMRSEFDREASFYAVGGVRGSLSWEDFLDMNLPIPPIEKQKSLVKDYTTLTSRISLNERLIATLESTAQTLYRKTFVDNIDPENLPEGWKIGTLEDVAQCLDSKRIPLASYERDKMEKIYPYYGAATLMDYVDNYLFDGSYILMGEDGTVMNEDQSPILQYVRGKFWVNNHAHVLKGKNGFDENLLYVLLSNSKIGEFVTGGVQAKLNQANLFSLKIVIPQLDAILTLKGMLRPIFNLKFMLSGEIAMLNQMQDLILSKMVL